MNLERYERGFSEDHRGNVEFFNELNLSDYKRFYTVTNPKIGTVRAWHGHKNEKKLNIEYLNNNIDMDKNIDNSVY